METATAEKGQLKIVRDPKVYLVGRQVTDDASIAKFLEDEDATWQTDTEVGAERLAEVAGRSRWATAACSSTACGASW
jgi:hypothetical protein